MTDEDIHVALVKAYELGRVHGYRDAQSKIQAERDINAWCSLRDELKAELHEKATL